jgi:hypothetical protein
VILGPKDNRDQTETEPKLRRRYLLNYQTALSTKLLEYNPLAELNNKRIVDRFQATTYHRSGGGKITVRPGQASPSVYLGSFQA